MKRTVTIGVFVLGVILFLNLYAIAQDKVVVIPLFGDATGPPAPVGKTGQDVCYNSAHPWDSCACGDTNCPENQDGDLEIGIAWPNPRFTDNEDGTVTDNLTGLIWLKNASCNSFFSGDTTGQNDRSWSDALTAVNSLANGYCGLTDGSLAGDWRLPNVRELHSLIDFGQTDPALPNGHPFNNVQTTYYWSSTSDVMFPSRAWCVQFLNGHVLYQDKSDSYYVHPVRDGN
jgi:hypothetical protein